MKLSRVNRFHDPASLGEKIQEEDVADLSQVQPISSRFLNTNSRCIIFGEYTYCIDLYKESQQILQTLVRIV